MTSGGRAEVAPSYGKYVPIEQVRPTVQAPAPGAGASKGPGRHDPAGDLPQGPDRQMQKVATGINKGKSCR